MPVHFCIIRAAEHERVQKRTVEVRNCITRRTGALLMQKGTALPPPYPAAVRLGSRPRYRDKADVPM